MLGFFRRLAAAISPTPTPAVPWAGRSLLQVAEAIAHAPADGRARPRSRSARTWVVIGGVLAAIGIGAILVLTQGDQQSSVARGLGVFASMALLVVGLGLMIANLSADEFSRISRFVAAVSPIAAVALSIGAAILAVGVAIITVYLSVFSTTPLLSNLGNLVLPAVAWLAAIWLATTSTSLGSPLVDLRKRAGRRNQIQRNTTVVFIVVLSGLITAVALSQPLNGSAALAAVAALAPLIPLSSAYLDRKRIDEAIEQMRTAATLALSAAEAASQTPSLANVQTLIERLYLLEDALSASSSRNWKRSTPAMRSMVAYARSAIAGSPIPARLESFRSHLIPLASMTQGQRLTATSDFVRMIRDQLV